MERRIRQRARQTPPDDDEVFVRRVLDGQPGALADFVRRVEPQVRRCVRRLLSSRPVDQDDVAQDTLLELVRGLGAYRGDCTLATWIERITTFVVLKRHRTLRLERRVFDTMTEAALSVPGPGSTERQTLTRSLIDRILDRLAHVRRERLLAWALFDLQGYTLEELASTLHITVAAAQSRVVRGRADVRKSLRNDDELRWLGPQTTDDVEPTSGEHRLG